VSGYEGDSDPPVRYPRDKRSGGQEADFSGARRQNRTVAEEASDPEFASGSRLPFQDKNLILAAIDNVESLNIRPGSQPAILT